MRIPVSKLLRPRLGGSVIDRTRLLEPPLSSPESGRDHRDADPAGNDDYPDGTVVLLSAPAGAGKTTLMADWARRRAMERERVAWLTLDRHDNDRLLFWSSLLTAVGGALGEGSSAHSPEAGEGVTAGDLSQRQNLVRLEALLAAEDEPLWLFLDDLQEISSNEVLADLDHLLRAMPPGIRVVLATRRDPPLAVNRLRLSGRLREIRAVDLAFERSEVRRILTDHEVVLDEPRLTLLMERTEGWAAGVRLAALALADAADPAATVHAFAGDEREVADYLAVEVLGALPPDQRDLMRVCAVPEQLTAELAIGLTGDMGTAQLLERLYRQNVLVEQLSEPGRSYRMHTLLRGYLLADLERIDPRRLARLHAETARWFSTHRQPIWALGHAAEAGDTGLAVEMLVRHGSTLLADGRGGLLRQFVDAAAPDVASAPVVRQLAALATLDMDRTTSEPLDHPPAPLRTAPDHTADAPERTVVEALVALERARRLDPAASKQALAASAALDGDSGDDLMMLLHQSRGVVQILAGELDAAEAELDEAIRLAEATDNQHALLRNTAALTGIASCRGDQRRTWALAEDTLRLGARLDSVRSPDVAFAVLQAAHVAYQRLEHAACGELAGWALAVAGANAEPTVRMSATALCAAVDVHEGADPSEAARRLRNCWSMAGDQPTSAVTTIRIAFAEHRCGWLTGHPEWAREALQRLQDGIGAGGDLQVLTATEHLVRGRGAAARRCVRAVLEDGEACVLPTSVQQAWLIEAVVADDVGETACSHEALRAALVIAEEFDVQHAFLDVPGAGRLLDENSRRFGRLDAVSERIRSAVAAEPGLGVSFLTPREVDVLTDLPSQLTLDEIAQRQQVSLNTVKTHVRAIYQKLDAGSRREAVVSARRRGLL